MISELINFTVKNLVNVKIIGKEIRFKAGNPDGNPIPAFWQQCFEDGTMDTLRMLPNQMHPWVRVGWIGNFNPADKTLSYIAGILTKDTTDTPCEMVSIHIPNVRFAVGTIKGTEPEIFYKAPELTLAEIEKNGLQLDSANAYKIAWCGEDFCKNEEYKILDMYIPVLG